MITYLCAAVVLASLGAMQTRNPSAENADLGTIRPRAEAAKLEPAAAPAVGLPADAVMPAATAARPVRRWNACTPSGARLTC